MLCMQLESLKEINAEKRRELTEAVGALDRLRANYAHMERELRNAATERTSLVQDVDRLRCAVYLLFFKWIGSIMVSVYAVDCSNRCRKSSEECDTNPGLFVQHFWLVTGTFISCIHLFSDEDSQKCF